MIYVYGFSSSDSSKPPLSVDRYGDVFSDVIIVLTLMHADVNNLSLGEQKGAFRTMSSYNKISSELWNDSRNEYRKLYMSLGFEDEAKGLARLLDKIYEIQNRPRRFHI